MVCSFVSQLILRFAFCVLFTKITSSCERVQRFMNLTAEQRSPNGEIVRKLITLNFTSKLICVRLAHGKTNTWNKGFH